MSARAGDRLGLGALGLALLVLALLVLGAVALTLLMNAGALIATLRGAFPDPDDAMRLVEVRAWLAGQHWFDMTALRLDPPTGSFMHWSRLVDLPTAAFIRLFGLAASPTMAERLACVAVPTLWLAALYVGVARLATILVGRDGRLPALLGTLFSGAALVLFAPGRIGHHAPETVALVFAVAAALAALDPRRAREAAVAGALVALSLAMSLETLPFQAVLAASLVAGWIWKGEALAATLLWFAGGLVVVLPVLFLAEVGPSRWLAPVCDAYGAPHLGAGMIAAAGLLVLGRLTSSLRSVALRFGGAAIVAGLVVAYVALCYPACLHSPFAGVDPLVRTLWLDHVVESLPLPAFAHRSPMLSLAVIAPLGLGLAGNLIAAFASRGVMALRFALLAALTAVGLALAFWQMRVVSSATPLGLAGAVYLVVRLRAWLAARDMALAATVAPAAILAFTSTAWALALPEDPPRPAAAATAACLAPEALAPLTALAPGSVVAPIESGSYLLAATRLDVFAAPYHRNDDGNRFAFDVFLAAPDAARALLARRHVAYVLTCPGSSDEVRLSAYAPEGLAAALAAGRVPAFLQPLAIAGTPYRAYAVRP